MHLDINPSTRWWEAQITAYRFQLENERVERRKLMAIEIKGLKADALTARANLDKIRAAYAKFNEAAPAHAADVEGLAESIGGMQSDLEFAATVMGNSSGESAERYFVGPADIMKINAEPPQGQQEAFVPLSQYDRVALGPHPDQPEGHETAVNGATFRTEAEKQIAAGLLDEASIQPILQRK